MKTTEKASKEIEQNDVTAPLFRTSASANRNVLQLTPQQQDRFLNLLVRGASPATLCQQLGMVFASYTQTCLADDEFRKGLQEVEIAKSQNVAAALYQTAMKGNVVAQKLWLEMRPPPGWSARSEGPTESDLLDELTDDELVELARAMEIAIPSEIEAAYRRRNPLGFSGGVSAEPQDHLRSTGTASFADGTVAG